MPPFYKSPFVYAYFCLCEKNITSQLPSLLSTCDHELRLWLQLHLMELCILIVCAKDDRQEIPARAGDLQVGLAAAVSGVVGPLIQLTFLHLYVLDQKIEVILTGCRKEKS